MNDSTAKTPTISSSLSMANLLQLALGFLGIQLAWNSQIALSQQVLEPLGAGPFIYGLVWCAGPLSGLLIQPIISSFTTNASETSLSYRKLLILGYSVLAMLGLIYFPQAPNLFMAGVALAVVDLTLNTAQGAYRTVVPDAVPLSQLPVANSFINFAFALAPVIALSSLPLLQVFNTSITLPQYYLIAGFAVVLLVCLGVFAIKNQSAHQPATERKVVQNTKRLTTFFGNLLESISAFSRASGAIRTLCAVQFCVWTGVMCLFIYLTPFVVHTIYELPDMAQPSYKKEESLYQLAQTVDAYVATEADYKTLSSTVTLISTQRQKLIVPTIADITALNTQLDEALVSYLGQPMMGAAVATIQHLAEDKELSEGISKTERVIELKLALLEFPLYEKKLDSHLEETEQGLEQLATLPLLEILDQQEFYADTNTEARNTAMLGFVIFNLVALLLTIPTALLSKKWGKKVVFTLALTAMAISFGIAPWVHSATGVFCMLAGAGIAWASILSIPFSLLNDHMTKGDERTLLSVFNLFICTPQFLAALAVGQWIEHSPVQTAFGSTHNWGLAFVFASAMVSIGIILLQAVKER